MHGELIVDSGAFSSSSYLDTLSLTLHIVLFLLLFATLPPK